MRQDPEREIDQVMERGNTRGARLVGKRVLYVDDEPVLRTVMMLMLQAEGGICIPACTHDHAVVQLSLEPAVDLAILDFEMPDGDVGDLVRRLREQQPRLPLLGTSGKDYRSEFAARGVDYFLPKPWRLDDLLSVGAWVEPG